MIRRVAFLVFTTVAAVAAGAAPAARTPRALAPAQPGAWEVSKSADGRNPVRVCVAELASLAQWEHRGGSCTRVVISDSGTRTVIHYTCANGGFGRSDMTLLTPRTLRIETQGISGGYPFAYTLHARRVAACAAR